MTVMDEIRLNRKLEAAKKDLKNWKSLSDIIGQPEPEHPDYHPWSSCLLYESKSNRLPESRSYCKNEKYGKCAFDYSCDTYMPKWREHHIQFHPNDDLLYVSKDCYECKRLQAEVARFMAFGISNLEKELNNPKRMRDLVARIVEEKKFDYRKPTEMPNELLSSIEATVEADLDSYFAEEEEFFEGMKVRMYTYERNPKLRSKAILLHGYKCKACGFDFKEKYGERGSEFIEVHHLNPVSSHEKETSLDPKTEMTVVCSNCHRMIHRRKDKILSLEELKKIIPAK
jgi:hypothetical protein